MHGLTDISGTQGMNTLSHHAMNNQEESQLKIRNLKDPCCNTQTVVVKSLGRCVLEPSVLTTFVCPESQQETETD